MVTVMEKQVLLVNPWIHDFAAYDFWAKPLGLLTLASILRENGFSVRLLDCLDPLHRGLDGLPGRGKPKRKEGGAGHFLREPIPRPAVLRDVPRTYGRYGLPPPAVREELRKIPPPDLVLVTSGMTYWYPGIAETIGIVREIFPAAPVVLGGNYATLCTEHARISTGADRVLPGKGEGHLESLAREFLGSGLAFLPDPDDLDGPPYPAFDLYPALDQVPLRTSRGCPFRCTYCAASFLDGRFLARDPISAVNEMEHWKKLKGVRHFSFYDDALLAGSRERAVPMMEEILRRNLECFFHCPNGLHLREVDEKVAGLMRKSGFRTLRFGFETSSVRRQLETGGKVTNDETREAVRHLRRAGYGEEEIGMYLLCGLPGQTADEIRASILFIRECGARPILAEYSPIPRTALWEEAVRSSPFDIAGEPLFQNNTLLPCRNGDLSPERWRELKALARNGSREIPPR